MFSGEYLADYTDTLGNGYSLIVPYIVMLVVLLVRPYGLFGHRDQEGLRCSDAHVSTPAIKPRRRSSRPGRSESRLVLLLPVAVLLPFSLPVINQLPIIRFIGDPEWIRLLTQAVIFGIAALGINLLSGRRRPGVTGSRLLHGRRRLHGGRARR